MEQPMQLALNGLMLSSSISEALIVHRGPLHNFLLLARSIENGDWDETDRLAAIFGVTKDQISEAYIKSVKWCDNILS
jgi:c-di-GMP-related signal transduction protein